jgi:hypothetical protein
LKEELLIRAAWGLIFTVSSYETKPGKAQVYGEMPIPTEVKKAFPAW